VRHIDLFPTVLESLSLKIPEHLSGKSFLPMLNGPETETPVFSEVRLDGQNRKSVIWQNVKVIEHQRGNTNLYEYFDLAADPMENKNDFLLHPVLFGYLKTVLSSWSRVQQQAIAALKKGPQAVIDPEMQETLKALGYLQ
jgi:hypothetical protein